MLEFAKFMEQYCKVNQKEKYNLIVQSIVRMIKIFIKKFEELESRITKFELGRNLPEIPSKVSGKELGENVTREVGNENVRGAFMNELKMIFQKKGL